MQRRHERDRQFDAGGREQKSGTLDGLVVGARLVLILKFPTSTVCDLLHKDKTMVHYRCGM